MIAQQQGPAEVRLPPDPGPRVPGEPAWMWVETHDRPVVVHGLHGDGSVTLQVGDRLELEWDWDLGGWVRTHRESEETT